LERSSDISESFSVTVLHIGSDPRRKATKLNNWRQIGDPASTVIGRMKSERAAVKVAQEFGGDKPNAGRSNVGLSPEAHPGEGDRSATGMGKDAGTEAPASSDREETSGNLGQPVLRLVMGSRDLSIANRRQRGTAPSPAMLKSLVLIEGGRHAAPRSITL